MSERSNTPANSARPAVPLSVALVPYVTPLNLGDRATACESMVQLRDVVIDSPFEKLSREQRIPKIVEAYNKNVKENVIVSAGARAGDRLEPGMFLLAHRNKVPEIAAGTGERLTLRITGGYTDTGVLGPHEGKYSQTASVIGEYGSYIVNVKQGSYAKIWFGNIPKLLGEGSHVIHETLFRVNDPLFCAMVDTYIGHGTIHIVRVPTGSLAKVSVESKPYLLPYRREPYAFSTALFQFHGVVGENEPHIDHGTLHILRVPAGSVAKAWLGSKPLLLEFREEPYFFDDSLFRKNATDGSIFTSANQKHISHGSINRLRPGVNGDVELAVVQHDGEIHFLDRFTTIDDPGHAVLGFLNMGLQTHVFPSRATREERKRDNPRATLEEVAYEPMTTRDSLKVGMKLLVAFQVSDPHLLLRRLRLNEFAMHVENLAVSDMARAVQNSTSQNFLHSSGRKQNEDVAESDMSITDRVRRDLADHLEECGLKLVRFNIEEAKVLDEELAKEMAKQALVAATASAQQSVIEQKAAIAKSNAELEAMAARVKQDQQNQIQISAAQAKLESEKLEAEAILVKAEAAAKAQALKGAQYREYPELLQLEMMRLQMDALKGSRVILCAESLANTPYVNLQTMMRQAFQDPTNQV